MQELRFRKILLPVDGSEASARAAEVAAGMALASGGELLLLHSHKHIADFIGEPYYQHLLDRLRGETRALLAPYRERLDAAGVPYDERVMDGDPAEDICTVAQVEDCDLVVMGRHGAAGVTGLLLGSVSHKVSGRAPCPVLTVR
ncbi:MAG TPA: universal stress protein [Deferrisomatales bacterium]|nr:universal stress protein [Deferrisomatales bacterium]